MSNSSNFHKNIQSISVSADLQICVDIDTHKELLRIVHSRGKNTRFEIQLDKKYYSMNGPNDLVEKKHKQTMSIDIGNYGHYHHIV